MKSVTKLNPIFHAKDGYVLFVGEEGFMSTDPKKVLNALNEEASSERIPDSFLASALLSDIKREGGIKKIFVFIKDENDSCNFICN